MEEAIARTIKGLTEWEEIKQFEENARAKGRLTADVQKALTERSADLARLLIAQRANIDLDDLSPAEEKIIQAVSEYVGLMRQQGKYPGRTLKQLRDRGLLDAAESSVAKAKPTQGYQTLVDAELEELSYEQIVVDHPEEFSPRALWYSRRTLGLPNQQSAPPTPSHRPLQTKTTDLLLWLKNLAEENDGYLPAFTNAEAAEAIGQGNLKTYGRDQGNIQSRLDFACYRCGLPPLGLAAEASFDRAWGQKSKDWDRDWRFPVAEMKRAAESRRWQTEDFDSLLRETAGLPGRAHTLWVDELAAYEAKVKDWAFGLLDVKGEVGDQGNRKTRNPPWATDELILALDLYLRHRTAPPGKESPEVLDLSNFLGDMGRALGVGDAATYRNANGVYMKMMNFRRFDPGYTSNGKVGLTRGNKEEEVVWADFSDDPKRLAIVVESIRASVHQHQEDTALSGADEPDICLAPEGRVLTRMHRVRERSRKLVEQAKKNALGKYKRLFCEACGFDFSEKYGPRGKDMIDVHHMKPVHTLATDGGHTSVDDLALLCPNCHRMVHSSRRWLSVAEVKALIENATRDSH